MRCRPKRFLVMAMLPIVCGCANNEGATRPGAREQTQAGSLFGAVVRGPTCPAQTPNAPCPSEPASGVNLIVLTQAGKEVATVVTDRDGKYGVTLPPGRYRIELGPLRGIEFTKDVPATLTIHTGRATRLDITIDTGMR
jgi:Carboxypeptidase regulatory-like domain